MTSDWMITIGFFSAMKINFLAINKTRRFCKDSRSVNSIINLMFEGRSFAGAEFPFARYYVTTHLSALAFRSERKFVFPPFTLRSPMMRKRKPFIMKSFEVNPYRIINI